MLMREHLDAPALSFRRHCLPMLPIADYVSLLMSPLYFRAAAYASAYYLLRRQRPPPLLMLP